MREFSNCHTTDDSLTALEGVFGDRIIIHDFCPIRLLDSIQSDSCLWDNWKDKVYRTNPRTKEELKKNTQREISELLRKNFFG
jgi:hypothetical protein